MQEGPEVTPMYNMEDAQGVLEHFVPCTYHETVQICEGLTIKVCRCGASAWSSSIEIWVTEDGETRKLVFSGDIGNYNRPLIRDPEYLEEADYVIMESTYGNRNHNTPPDYAAELAKVMNSTFTKGGNLVIPAFSVGRTQEMLYYMRQGSKPRGCCRSIRDLKYISTVRLPWRQQIFFIRVWKSALMRKQDSWYSRASTRSSFRD